MWLRHFGIKVLALKFALTGKRRRADVISCYFREAFAGSLSKANGPGAPLGNSGDTSR